MQVALVERVVCWRRWGMARNAFEFDRGWRNPALEI